jgi:hypothetical protein
MIRTLETDNLGSPIKEVWMILPVLCTYSALFACS